MDECCYLDPDATTATADLYQSYKAWADREGDKPITSRAFARILTAHGIGQRKAAGGQRIRTGITLSGASGASGGRITKPPHVRAHGDFSESGATNATPKETT